MYGHQINWVNACNDNLDNGISQLVQSGLIDLLSTLTSNLLEPMKNVNCCTLYEHKKIQPLERAVQY